MSTKTTIKRIALVAVSALGLGVLTSVAPASALTTEYVTAISASAASVPVAGTAGASVDTTVYFKTSTTTTTLEARPKALLISTPSTSTLAEDSASSGTYAGLIKGEFQFTTDNSGAATTTAANYADRTLGNTDGTGEVVNRSSTGTANAFGTYHLVAHYDVAGTYKWVFFDDLDNSGTINGSEFSVVHTVVVANGTAAITATSTAHNSTSGAGSTNGALVKVSLKDASGNAANVDSAGGVRVTVSGSGVVAGVNGDMSVTDASTYTLGRANFNGSGNAWINVKNAEAEVVSVTLTGVGSTTLSGGEISLTFVATAGTTSGQVSGGAATTNIGTIASNAADAKLGATIYLKTAGNTTAKDDIDVVDTFGTITGKAGTEYSLAVAGSATATYPGAFSIATGTTVAGQTFTVNLNGGTAVTFTAAAQSRTGGAVKTLIAGGTSYSATASLTSAKLATITVTVKAYDQFSGLYANSTITPSFSAASRNYGQVLGTFVTGAAGTATFTFTDANTSASTTATQDVISFSDGTNTGTLTITYAADADYGVSTIVMDSNDTDSLGVALPASSITPVGITTGDGAETATGDTVTVTLKNSAGTLISGVPVVWSISGSGAALDLPTGLTSYSVAGVASAKVYAWISGTYTVTAKAGSKSASATVTFLQTATVPNTAARIVSATASGNTVTAKVVDRFGNGVKNVDVTASTTGGYFGSGSTTATGRTGAAGTVDFVLIGSGTVTVEVDPASYPQVIAVKDASDYDSANTYTATVAATATAAATGIGATYAPAGVKSASVEVTGVATSDSIDAANEATDAANAATDAANAAAEAADAATAAAQDAQAAVAELATKVASLIAGIKAQITTLTNLVIKIQKKVRA